MIEELIKKVAEHHYPRPGASRKTLEAFQATLGFPLPADMAQFYRFLDGASLFDAVDPPYQFLPLRELCHPSGVVASEGIPEGTEYWLAFCDVRDGNYVAIDLKTGKIMDCFHETFGKPEYDIIIAESFTEFLARALSDAKGNYWIHDGDEEEEDQKHDLRGSPYDIPEFPPDS